MDIRCTPWSPGTRSGDPTGRRGNIALGSETVRPGTAASLIHAALPARFNP
jgi:hypothetical protein